MTTTECVSLWVSQDGFLVVGVLMSGETFQKYNSTIKVMQGWTQVTLSLAKHGIGAPINQKTSLTLRVYNRNKERTSTLLKFFIETLPGGYLMDPGATRAILFGHKGSIATPGETTSFHFDGIIREFKLTKGAVPITEAVL